MKAIYTTKFLIKFFKFILISNFNHNRHASVFVSTLQHYMCNFKVTVLKLTP